MMKLNYETPPPPETPRDGSDKWGLVVVVVVAAVVCGVILFGLSRIGVPATNN